MKNAKKTSNIMKIVIASAIILLTFFASFAMSLTIKNRAGTVSETSAIRAVGFSGGDGSESNPYIIPNAGVLRAFRNSVNSGTTYANIYIKLGVSDIDTRESGKVWEPIGNTFGRYFAGTFDGNGKLITVSLATYSTTTGQDTVFSHDGTDVSVSGLFGVNYGVIKNVRVGGTITGDTNTDDIKYIGGICGANGGIIDHCQNNIDLTPTSSSNKTYYGEPMGVQGSVIGGIVGCSLPAISLNRDFTGAGHSMISITNCENRGLIYGNIAGGILGSAYYGPKKSAEEHADTPLYIDSNSKETRTTFLSYNVNNISSSGYVRGYIAGGILGTANAYNFTITNNVNICNQVHAITLQTQDFSYVCEWNAFDMKLSSFYYTTEYNSGVTSGAAGGIVGSDFNKNGDYTNPSSLIIENNVIAGVIRSDIWTDAENTHLGTENSEFVEIRDTWNFNNYTIGNILSSSVMRTITNNRRFSTSSHRVRFVYGMENSGGNMQLHSQIRSSIREGRYQIKSSETSSDSDTYDTTLTTLTKTNFGTRSFNSLGTIGFDSSYWTKGNILSVSTSKTSMSSYMSVSISNLSMINTTTSAFNTTFTKNIETDYHTANGASLVGSGTNINPYIVDSVADLIEVSELGGYAMLSQDIDLAGKYWKPIDASVLLLDGRGFKIKNLTCEEYTNAGLFSRVYSVSNLILEDCKVVSFGYSSPFGFDTSIAPTLSKVEVSGYVSGAIETAGVSFSASSLDNVVSKATIVGAGKISGIVNQAQTLTNCINGTSIVVYPNNGGSSTVTAKALVAGISLDTNTIDLYHCVTRTRISNFIIHVPNPTTDRVWQYTTTAYGSGAEVGVLTKSAITEFDESSEYPSWDTTLYFYDGGKVPSLDLRLEVNIKGYTINQKYDSGSYVYDSDSISASTWYPTFTSYKEDFVGSNSGRLVQDLTFSLAVAGSDKTATYYMVKGEQVNFTINSNDLCMFSAYSTQGGNDIDITKLDTDGGFYSKIERSLGKGTGSLVLSNNNYTNDYGYDSVDLRIYATNYIILDIAPDGYNGVSPTFVNGTDKKSEFTTTTTNPYHYDTGNLKAVEHGATSITMWSGSGTTNFPILKRTGYILKGYKIREGAGIGETLFTVNSTNAVSFSGSNNTYLYSGTWTNMTKPVVYIKPLFEAETYTVTENVNKNTSEYVKFTNPEGTVKVNTTDYSSTVAKNSVTVTYETTEKIDIAERYGYTFIGWYTNTGIQITDDAGKFVESDYVDKITISGTETCVWTNTTDVTLYAYFTVIYRKVNFKLDIVDYTISASLNVAHAFVKKTDYGYFDSSGIETFKSGNQIAKLYTHSTCTTLITGDIVNTPSAWRFDGWFTAKDTAMVAGTENGNLVLKDDLIINNDVIISGTKYTNGHGGISFESTGDMTVYAHFTILTYKIKLVVDNSSYESINNKYKVDSSEETDSSILYSYVYALYGSNFLTDKNSTIAGGYTTETISTGLRPGYNFDGWYLEEPTYDSNGTRQTTGITLTKIINTNAKLESGKTGYTDGSGNWTRVEGLTEGITLYAHFEKNTGANLKFATSTEYSTKVNINATSTSVTNGTQMNVSMYTSKTYKSNSFTDSNILTFTNAVNNADYVFEGWYFDVTKANTKIWDPYTGLVANAKDKNGKMVTNSSGEWEWTVELTGTTIYPKFVPMITIKLNKDNGTISKYYVAQNSEKLYLNIADLKGNKGDSTYITNTNNANKLITDTKTGYEFNGWYFDKTDTTSRLLYLDGTVIKSFSYGGKNYTDNNYKFIFNPSDSNYTIDLYSKFSISYFEVEFLTSVIGGNKVANKDGVSKLFLRFGDNNNLYKITGGAGTEADPYRYSTTEIPTIYNFYLANGNTLGSGITGIKGYRLRWYHSVDGTDPVYSTRIDYDLINDNVPDEFKKYNYKQFFLDTLWSNITDFDGINPIEFYPHIESDLTKVKLNISHATPTKDNYSYQYNKPLQYTVMDLDGNVVKQVVNGTESIVTLYFDFADGRIYADYEKTLIFASHPILETHGGLFYGWYKNSDGVTDLVLKPTGDINPGMDGVQYGLTVENGTDYVVSNKFEFNPIGYHLYGRLIPKTYRIKVDYENDATKTDLDLYIQHASRTFYLDEGLQTKYDNSFSLREVSIDIDKKYGYNFQYWGIAGTNVEGELIRFTETAKEGSTSVKVNARIDGYINGDFVPTMVLPDTTQKVSGVAPIAFTLVGVYEAKFIDIEMYADYSIDNFKALYNINEDSSFVDTSATRKYQIIFDSFDIYPFISGTIGTKLSDKKVTKTGFRFLGWYLESQFDDNGNLLNSSSLTQVINSNGVLLDVEYPKESGKYISKDQRWLTEETMKLYAHFEVVEYTIYFIPDQHDTTTGKNSVDYFAKDDNDRHEIFANIYNPHTGEYEKLEDYTLDSEKGYYYFKLYYGQAITITCNTIPDTYKYVYSLGDIYNNSTGTKDENDKMTENLAYFTDPEGSEYYFWVNVNREYRKYGVTLQMGDLFDDGTKFTTSDKDTFAEIFKYQINDETNEINKFEIWFEISGSKDKHYINYNFETGEFEQVLGSDGNTLLVSYDTEIFLYCALQDGNTVYSYNLRGWTETNNQDLSEIQKDVYRFKITALGKIGDTDEYYPMIGEEGYVDQNVLTISAERIINIYKLLLHTNTYTDPEENNEVVLTRYVKYGTNKFYELLEDAKAQNETGYLNILPVNNGGVAFKLGYEFKSWFINNTSNEREYVFAISNGEIVVLENYNVKAEDNITTIFNPSVTITPVDYSENPDLFGVCELDLYAGYREQFYAITLVLDGGQISNNIENTEQNIFYVQYLSDKLFIKDYKQNVPNTDEFGLITYTETSFNQLGITKTNYFFTSFVFGNKTIVDYLDYEDTEEFMFVKETFTYNGNTYLDKRTVNDIEKYVWVYTGEESKEFHAIYRGEGKKVNLQVDNQTVYTLIVEYGTKDFYNVGDDDYSIDNMYPENPLTAAEIAEIENLTYVSEVDGKTYNAVQKEGNAFLGWDYVFNNITSTKDPQMVFDFNGNYKLYDNSTSTGVELTDDTVATGADNILITNENGNWIAVVEDIKLQAKYTALGYRIILNANSPTGDGGNFGDPSIVQKSIYVKYYTNEFYSDYTFDTDTRIPTFVGGPIEVDDLPKSIRDGYFLNFYYAIEEDSEGNPTNKTIIENINVDDAENKDTIGEENIHLQFADTDNKYFAKINEDFKWIYVYAEGENHIDFYAAYIKSLRNIQLFISNDKNNNDQNIDSVKLVIDYMGRNVDDSTTPPTFTDESKTLSIYGSNHNLFIQNGKSYFYADVELLEYDLHSLESDGDDRDDYNVTSVYAEKYGYTFLGWYDRPVAYDIDQNPVQVAFDDDGNYLFDEKGNFILDVDDNGNNIPYDGKLVINSKAELIAGIEGYTTDDGKWSTTTKTTILYPVFKANLYMMNFADEEYSEDNSTNTYQTFFYKFNTDNIYYINQDSTGIKDEYGYIIIDGQNIKFDKDGYLIKTDGEKVVDDKGNIISLLNIELVSNIVFNKCSYSDLLTKISKFDTGYNFGGYAVDMGQNLYNYISNVDPNYQYQIGVLDQLFVYKQYANNKLQLVNNSVIEGGYNYTYDTDKTLNVPVFRYLLQDQILDPDTSEVISINYRFAVADHIYLYPIKVAKKYEINFIISQTDDGAGNITYEYETYYVEFNSFNIYDKKEVTDQELINAGEYDLYIVNLDGSTSYYVYERTYTEFPPIVFSGKNYERIKGWKLVSTSPDADVSAVNLDTDVLLGRFFYDGSNNPSENNTIFNLITETSIIDKNGNWSFAGDAVFTPVYENNGYSITFKYVEDDEKTNLLELVQDEEDPDKVEFETVVDGDNSHKAFTIYNLYDDSILYSNDSRTTQNRIEGLTTFAYDKLPILSSLGYTFIGWEATLEDTTKLMLIYDSNLNSFVINETDITNYTWKLTEDLVFIPVFEANYYSFEFVVEEKSSINKDGIGTILHSEITQIEDESITSVTFYYLFDTNEVYVLTYDDEGNEEYTLITEYKNPTAKQIGYRFSGWTIENSLVTNQNGEWITTGNDILTENYYSGDKFIYADNNLQLKALFEAVNITINFNIGTNIAKNDTGIGYNILEDDFQRIQIGEGENDTIPAYSKDFTIQYDKELTSSDELNLVNLTAGMNIPSLTGYNFKGWIVILSDGEFGYLYEYNSGTNSLMLKALENYTKQFNELFVFNYVSSGNEHSDSQIQLYPYFEAIEYTITLDYNFDAYNKNNSYSTYDNPDKEVYYIKYDTNKIYKRDENQEIILASEQYVTYQGKKADFSPNFLEGHTFLGWGIFNVDGNNNDVFKQILAYYEDNNGTYTDNTVTYSFKLGEDNNGDYFQNIGSNKYVFKLTKSIELVAKYEIKKFDVYFVEYVKYDKTAKELVADPIKELPQKGESTTEEFEYPYTSFSLPTNFNYKYDGADGYYRNKSTVNSTTQIYKKVQKDYGKTLTELSYVAFQQVDNDSFINPYYMVSSWDGKIKTLIGLYQFNQQYKTGEDGKILTDENGKPIIDKNIYNEKFTKDILMLKELNVDKTLIIELVYQLNSFNIEFYKRINDTDYEIVYTTVVNYGEKISSEDLKAAKALITDLQTDAFNYTFTGSWMYKDTLDNFGTGTVITKKIQLIPSYKKTDREYIVQFIDESTGAMIDMTSLLSVNSSSGFYLTPPQDKTSIAFRVKYGNTFDFVINLVEGYTNSIYNVVYYKSHLAEGEKVVENNVQPNMFGYSIEVFNDVSIKVKNVKLNTYTVTFKMPNGTVVSKDVTHGYSVIDKPTVEVGFLQFVRYSRKTDRVTDNMEVIVKIIDVRIYAIIAVAVVIIAIIISAIVKSNRKKQQKKALAAQSAHLMNSFGSLNKTYTGQNPQQPNGNNPQQNTFGSTPSGHSVGGTNTTTNTNQTPPSTGATNTNTNPYANNGSSTGGSSTSSSTNNSNPYKNPYSDK